MGHFCFMRLGHSDGADRLTLFPDRHQHSSCYAQSCSLCSDLSCAFPRQEAEFVGFRSTRAQSTLALKMRMYRRFPFLVRPEREVLTMAREICAVPKNSGGK